MRGQQKARPNLQLAAGLAVAAALLYLPVLTGMVREWYSNEDYSHGFLIPIISAYLLWQRRKELSEAAGYDRLTLGLFVCLTSVCVLIVGRAGAEFFLQRFSFVLFLIGGVLWLFGRSALRLASAPLLLLFLMIPLPYLAYDAVAFPLKLLAARVATTSLDLIRIPVFREGNLIHLPGQTLEVADACSGMRSLMTLVTLGVVYAYFSERVTWKRLLIVLSTIPIAVVTNAGRVTGTGLLTHYVSPKAAEGFFHSFSGWLVFIAAFLLLLALRRLLHLAGRREADGEAAEEELEAEKSVVSGMACGGGCSDTRNTSSLLAGPPVRVGVLLLLALSVSGYLRFLSDVHPVPLRAPLGTMPRMLGEWSAVTSETMTEAVLQTVGVEDYLWRSYRNPQGLSADVYVGYYEQQQEGDTIHSPKHCLPGGGWQPLKSDQVTFATPGFNGGTTRAQRYVIQKGDRKQFVLYWFQHGRRNITNEYAAKFYLVFDSTFRKRSDGSLIRLITPMD
ncbi:MAG: VPLPA-CTERM-specific exosortase XrtD, partial [Deltaproteobacteria bacterium]|nr:VPLPA-CTERM-specific exosortase XrtD [Deltaproteobacteria bacterium]